MYVIIRYGRKESFTKQSNSKGFYSELNIMNLQWLILKQLFHSFWIKTFRNFSKLFNPHFVLYTVK